MSGAGLFDPAVPLFVGIPGGLERVVILLVVVVLFGPSKLPQLARSLGEAQAEFQNSREAVSTEPSDDYHASAMSGDGTTASIRG